MRFSGTLVLSVFLIGGIAVTALPGMAGPRPARTAPPALAPFDLVVESGQTLIIDTSVAILTDVHGQTLTFTGGNVFASSLEVKAGGKIRGQGPNALRFFVSGSVLVEGAAGTTPAAQISVDGAKAPDVAVLGALVMAANGAGTCGGGDGGLGNPDTTKSCPIGANGEGPFGIEGAGGHGGESSLFVSCGEVEDRHPAGGGGGSFATLGEKGNDGTSATFNAGSCSVTQGSSAMDPALPPRGGDASARPFSNAEEVDDFLGIGYFRRGIATSGTILQIVGAPGSFSSQDAGRWIALRKSGSATWEGATTACVGNNAADPTVCFRSKMQLRKIASVLSDTTISLASTLPSAIAAGDSWVIYGTGGFIAGELVGPMGGAGGGAGGNAIGSGSLGNPNYALVDKKGAGGGGAGGVLEIYAIGEVSVHGSVTASGGGGAAGESMLGSDRIGGGSGGASGGMIRIQSATAIHAEGAFLLARGGRRGAGAFNSENDPKAPTSPQGIGHGGRGGKGIIQLHAPIDAAANPLITFSPGQPASSNFDPAPVLAWPEFFEAGRRQRAAWFGGGK